MQKKTLQVQTIYADSTENEKFLRNDKAKVKLKGKSFLTILLVGSNTYECKVHFKCMLQNSQLHQ